MRKCLFVCLWYMICAWSVNTDFLNLIQKTCTENCKATQIFIKIELKCRTFYMKTYKISLCILSYFPLSTLNICCREKVPNNDIENNKAYILCPIHCFRKSCVIWDYYTKGNLKRQEDRCIDFDKTVYWKPFNKSVEVHIHMYVTSYRSLDCWRGFFLIWMGDSLTSREVPQFRVILTHKFHFA
jgi:hypothetical protein